LGGVSGQPGVVGAGEDESELLGAAVMRHMYFRQVRGVGQ